jgi:hypothetical protein
MPIRLVVRAIVTRATAIVGWRWPVVAVPAVPVVPQVEGFVVIVEPHVPTSKIPTVTDPVHDATVVVGARIRFDSHWHLGYDVRSRSASDDCQRQ